MTDQQQVFLSQRALDHLGLKKYTELDDSFLQVKGIDDEVRISPTRYNQHEDLKLSAIAAEQFDYVIADINSTGKVDGLGLTNTRESLKSLIATLKGLSSATTTIATVAQLVPSYYDTRKVAKDLYTFDWGLKKAQVVQHLDLAFKAFRDLIVSLFKSARTNVYLVMPSNFSGDLWHVAAALSLASKYGEEDNFPYHVVVLELCAARIQTEVKTVIDFQDQCEKFGKVSFNYFRDLGLERILVEIDLGGESGASQLEAKGKKLPSAYLDELYYLQKESNLDFAELRQRPTTKISNQVVSLLLKAPQTVDETFAAALTEDIGYPLANAIIRKATSGGTQARTLGLMTATTIAMNFLYRQNERNLAINRYSYLAQAMCSATPGKNDQEVEKLAKEKFTELQELVKHVLDKTKKKRVILENYRKNSNNWGTNSNLTLSKFFIAEAKDYAVITIPAVNQDSYLDELKAEDIPIFDLYGRRANEPYPGVEARAQCRFWALVAEDPRVAGVFGGRSGSIDVAAFNGMKAFYWDEPWIRWCSLPADAPDEMAKNNKKGRESAKEQVHQCLRSLQLSGIMGVGLAKGRQEVMFENKPNAQWTGVEKEQLDRWMASLDPEKKAQHSWVFPEIGKITTWRLVSQCLADGSY